MARPETPVDHTIPELGQLAELLRSLRRKAGLTYTELAARSGYSAATLKRAASGRTLPDVIVAFGYALACEIVPAQSSEQQELRGVILQWQKARKAVKKAQQAARRSSVVPKPQLARDEADLSGALRDAWTRAGRPSTRAMEKASNGQVPRSTASVISSAHTVPRDFRQYIAYLRVCKIKGQALTPWIRAWFKIREVPAELQPGLKALHDDGDAQAAYVDLYAQATHSALSVAEVLQQFAPPDPTAKKRYSYVRSGPWQEQFRSALKAERLFFCEDSWQPFPTSARTGPVITYLNAAARAHAEQVETSRDRGGRRRSR
ncbi:transcriptional regulator with XRE-family HTH domain [Streptomyces canus]|uniref:Transcriptional regulator with XRE-family HTH domain n=1 Tax=Streptomyces canus TaxID=58343 RepID=A0AAW8F2R8_9ACTN|nr:helix-turn-helix transcriptional regulator [Streptomyces canus]MDQ0904371.1 transcriptional regulator with XRE-family HTH domain [Streptomyces canus]